METIAAIQEAAAQILEAEGVAGFSTNRIAARAGVSIGSLYQYYSDKSAILADIARRRVEEARANVERQVLELADGGEARSIIQTLVAAFGGPRETRLALFDALLANLSPDERVHYLTLLMDRTGDLLAAGRELPREVVFVLTRSVIGVLRYAVVEDGPELDWSRLEEELLSLVEGYVGQLARRAAGAGSGSA